MLEQVQVTSEYRGAGLAEGTRSVTFRLVFRAPDRTLRDADVDAVEQQVLDALGRELGLSRR